MHKEENPTGTSAILETQQGFRFRYKGGNGDTKSGMRCTPITTGIQEERQAERPESEASLASIHSSKAARATQ